MAGVNNPVPWFKASCGVYLACMRFGFCWIAYQTLLLSLVFVSAGSGAAGSLAGLSAVCFPGVGSVAGLFCFALLFFGVDLLSSIKHDKIKINVFSGVDLLTFFFILNTRR